MNKIFGIFAILTNCILITSCVKSNAVADGPAPEGSIPHNFVCWDKEYVFLKNAPVISGAFNKIGWLINNKDLEKWKEIDKDENIVYALSMENAVERHMFDENLIDRWELSQNSIDKSILKIEVINSIFVEKEQK